MNVSVIADQQCYGCGICSIVCSGGVKLRTDKDGYYKSQIIEDKCTDCGRCLTVCPYNNCSQTESAGKSYVTFSKDGTDVIGSSSGGIAHVIARHYLRDGYAIIGAAWSEDYRRVEHIVVTDESGLGRLRKSKYVQSYTPDAFRQIKELDKVVVFGTPCQIAGLRNLYGDRPGMVLIDFDCMGPSGLTLWNKYVDHISKGNGTGIRTLEMRNKKHSWMKYGTRIVYGDGKEYFKDKYHDPFCVLYHLGHTIQDACIRACKYLNDSKADMRIGDAWNYTDGYGSRQIHDGLSIVTPYTQLGENVLEQVKDVVVMKPVSRIPNKAMQHGGDEKVWESLRNPYATMMDALAAYNDVGVGKRITRSISNLLSANDTLYLLIKRMLRAIR